MDVTTIALIITALISTAAMIIHAVGRMQAARSPRSELEQQLRAAERAVVQLGAEKLLGRRLAAAPVAERPYPVFESTLDAVQWGERWADRYPDGDPVQMPVSAIDRPALTSEIIPGRAWVRAQSVAPKLESWSGGGYIGPEPIKPRRPTCRDLYYSHVQAHRTRAAGHSCETCSDCTGTALVRVCSTERVMVCAVGCPHHRRAEVVDQQLGDAR